VGAVTEQVVAASTYARWRATTLGRITEAVEVETVFGLTGDLRGRRLLDVGTGDGAYAIEAARRGARVTGLDPQVEMLDAARARAHKHGVEVSLREGRAEALPFGDASFEVVTAVTVLCFVTEPTRAVREIARVLVPGGRLVLGELGRYSVWAAERRIRGWFGARTWRRARFWSRRELRALVRDAGLRVASVRDCVYFPPIGGAARALAPIDPLLGRVRAPGAAFLAVAADRPEVHP
jgi:ubiquinone/menaquinone biosynthesis C-methylase UbiE